MEEKAKAKYECLNCGSLYETDIDTDPSKLMCCKKPSPTLIGSSDDSEPSIVIEKKESLKKLYYRLKEIINYYMDLPEKQQKLIVIWIIGTYFHKSFPTFPFLFINAMRGSGKTRLLKLISHLAYEGKGMVSTEPTESILYRTPKHQTLVFDEFESIGSKDKGKFRQYLNASYKEGGVVQRSRKVKKDDGEGYEIETFEPYKPIAMANIWGMEEVLEDRCLTVVLQKSNNPAKTKKIEDFERNEEIKLVKRGLISVVSALCALYAVRGDVYLWNDYINNTYKTTLTTLTTPFPRKKDNSDPLKTTLKTTQTTLHKIFEKIDSVNIDGRNLELIFPILLTAKTIDFNMFDEILDICVKLVKSKKDEEIAESKDVALIDFIANAYDGSKLNFITVRELTNHFKGYLNELDDVEDKWLNTKWLGRALKRLDLVLDKRRLARGNEVTLDIKKAREKMNMFKPGSDKSK